MRREGGREKEYMERGKAKCISEEERSEGVELKKRIKRDEEKIG